MYKHMFIEFLLSLGVLALFILSMYIYNTYIGYVVYVRFIENQDY